MVVLSVQSLCKKYRDKTVINNLSFEIQEGEIFGLLGPNGSGKTTTIGMIYGLIRPNKGSIKIFGKEKLSHSEKLQISGTLEQPNFYPYLTGQENLSIVAKIKKQPVESVSKVLQDVNLEEASSKLFSKYSLGMKQRLSIAAALINDPKLLVLDEPTNGLDPEGIIETRNLMKSLSGKGKTIFLTSHMLTEIEKICTHVGFLKGGTIVQKGTVSEFGTDGRVFQLKSNDFEGLQAQLVQYQKLTIVEQKEDAIIVELDDRRPDMLNKFLCSKDIFLTELTPCSKGLEDVFLKIFQQKVE